MNGAPRFAALLIACTLLLPAAAGPICADESRPANQPANPPAQEPAAPSASGSVTLPEFGDVPVVAWTVEDKWVFGGDRFHKANHYYQPVDPAQPHPWVITRIEIKTWFQQDVIDGFAPSLTPLLGDAWKEAKKFMEQHKYGGSIRFEYVVTDKKFVLFHDKGKPREKKLALDVVPGGLENFFTEPKRENFTNVDGMKPDAAHKIAVERYQARLAWADGVRKGSAQK